MTQEDKLKEAKRLYQTANADQKYVLESLFPELKESEDEKIRKELIAEVKEKIDCIPAPDCRDKEDEKALKQLNKWIAWLEKQGEQKPWSEEDETIKNNISHIIRQYDKISKRENQPCYYVGDCLLWMQNIKDRVQPQPKQEWSEEDEKTIVKMRDFFIRVLGDKPDFTEDKRYEEFIEFIDNRLKSIIGRFTWKPSDEQMEALLSEVSAWTKGCPKQIVLESLYNDLKKL